MRNKKISKLVDPSFRLYFLVGFLFAAVTVRVSIPLAICEAAAMAFLWWYFRHTAQKRREGIRQYIDDVMYILVREFSTPDEEMRKIVIKVVKQCVQTDGIASEVGFPRRCDA